jgi:hypothetical protein
VVVVWAVLACSFLLEQILLGSWLHPGSTAGFQFAVTGSWPLASGLNAQLALFFALFFFRASHKKPH